jgi:hypothetical protein
MEVRWSPIGENQMLKFRRGPDPEMIRKVSLRKQYLGVRAQGNSMLWLRPETLLTVLRLAALPSPPDRKYITPLDQIQISPFLERPPPWEAAKEEIRLTLGAYSNYLSI